MYNRFLTTLLSLMIMFIWTTLVVAQDAKEVYSGTYQNQLVPSGQNIPLEYDGPFAVLHDNGPLATHPGGGFGGADASALQTALGMGTYGYGHAISAGYTVADDFTITGDDWTVEELHFFAYQTGSTTTSTMNDYRVEIYSGNPSSGGTLIWGNLTTNVLTSSTWSNIYRVLDTDLLASNRPVMESVVDLATPLVLSAGTYWIRWQAGGTLSSGPWQPPVTVLGSTGTGNALQENAGTWTAIVDVGPQDLPFLIIGTSGSGGGNTFFENFEGFAVGGQVACQDPTNWTTWSQLPCSAEDATVSSNYAHSGTNSFVIVPANDFVKPLGDKTTGKWWVSFWVYMPTGKGGYFNTLNTFPASSSGHWGMEVYFDVGGVGRLLNGATVNFSWTANTWQYCEVIVDLDLDQAQFWFNGSQVGTTWQWTRGNPGTYALRVAANDFYGPLQTSADECYYDDYWFGDEAWVPVELTSFAGSVNNLGQVVLNWQTASELNNHMFEIERRTETSEFRTVGFVEGHGTTTQQNSYSYIDKTAEQGVNYYRLKQVDFNGTYSYSDIVEIDVVGPLTFDLAQNYPNPFNPSTNIKYSVPEAGNIRLSVYNLVGEEVAVLVDGFSQAGFYEVTFDASNLSTGVYLYKLQSANSVQTKKMMLLK